MRAIKSPELSDNEPLFVDLVASPDAANSGIPDNARYFEISGSADSICDPVYCPSKAPNKLKGSFHFGAAVSGRHATGPFDAKEVRADIDGRMWIRLRGQDLVIMDVHGFACGRSFLNSEVQLRLFAFGQEVEFHEEIAPSATADLFFSDSFEKDLGTEVVVPPPLPFPGPEFHQYTVGYRVSGHIDMRYGLIADSNRAELNDLGGFETVDLKIRGRLLTPIHPWVWVDTDEPSSGVFGDAVERDLSDYLPIRVEELPRVTVKRQELALHQTRYSYSVDADSKVSFLQNEIGGSDKIRLRYDLVLEEDPDFGFTNPEVEYLLHPIAMWTDHLSESGSETIGSAPEALPQSDVAEAEPGFWQPGVDYLYAFQTQSTTQSEATIKLGVREISGHLAVTR